MGKVTVILGDGKYVLSGGKQFGPGEEVEIGEGLLKKDPDIGKPLSETSDEIMDQVKSMSVVELREELKARELDPYGAKKVLVARLTEAIKFGQDAPVVEE